jgi:hypothetical protein
MIKRNTWILLLVFVVVLGAAIVIQQTNLLVPAAAPTATPALSLLDFGDDNIIGITLADPNGLNIVAKIDSNNQWSITKPANLQISQGSMQEILSELNGISIQSTLLSPLPLESTGLQLPAYTLTLNYSSGKDHTIKVGSLTATKSGYYLQLDANEAVIVSQYGIDDIVQLLKSVTFTPTPSIAPATSTPTVDSGAAGASTPTPAK